MKKDFTLKRHEVGAKEACETTTKATTIKVDRARVSKPANTLVAFPENTTNTRNADFGQFYGQGFDDITAACQCTLEKLVAESAKTNGKSLSMTTIVGYWNVGFRFFAPFLSLLHAASGKRLTMADLNAETIKRFIQHLRNEPIVRKPLKVATHST